MFGPYAGTGVSLSFPTLTSRAVNGGQMPTSTGASSGRSPRRRSQYSAACARVPHSFQLPAISGLREPPAPRAAPAPTLVSCVIQHLHARQRLALEQLERRATAGREVVHVVREAELREGGPRVAASDDGRARRVR